MTINHQWTGQAALGVFTNDVASLDAVDQHVAWQWSWGLDGEWQNTTPEAVTFTVLQHVADHGMDDSTVTYIRKHYACPCVTPFHRMVLELWTHEDRVNPRVLIYGEYV